MTGLLVMRRRWIAMVIALAGCGDSAPDGPDAPERPDCSRYQQDEPPVVPDGAVPINEYCDAGCPAIAAAGDGFWGAWVEGETRRMRVRRLDSSGVPSGSFYDFSPGCPAITHRNGITAVAWNNSGGIRVARFDDDGMLGEVVAVPPGEGRQPPSVTASSEGYALIWAENRTTLGPRDVYFAALDEEGALLGEPRLLAAGEIGDETTPIESDTTFYDGPDVATVPDGLVAVWYTRTTIEMHLLDGDGTELAVSTSQPAQAPNGQYEYDLIDYFPQPLHLAASSTGVLTGWRPDDDSIRLHVTEAALPSLETGTTTSFAVPPGYFNDPLITPTVSPDGFLALWKSSLPDEGTVLQWVSLDRDGDQVGGIESLRADVQTYYPTEQPVDVAHGSDGYVLVFANYYGDLYAMPLPM